MRDAQGLVTIHGYLRKYVMEQAGKMPEECKKEELIPALAAAMHTAGVRLGRARMGSEVAAKLVFTISPEVSNSWKAASLDIDAGLRYIVTQTMERYRLGVMDGAEVGYAVGIHHDKEHQHAHIILMLHAENGKRLKLSNRHQVKLPDGSVRRVDHLTLLTNTAISVLIEYQKKLTTPTSAIGQRGDYIPDIQRWITLAACDRVPKELKGKEAELFRTQEKERLRRAPAAEIIGAIDNAYHKRQTLFRQCQNAALSPAGRDKLIEGEVRYRALINQYSNAAREVAAQQRRVRKERLALLKGRQAELNILNKLQKITKLRLTSASIVVIDEIQKELMTVGSSNPALGKLIDERIRIATRLTSGQAFDRQAKLAEALNRKNIDTWRESLQRQYSEAKGAADKIVHTIDFDASSCAAYIESLKANLDIYKCALESRTPSWLHRYAKLRADKDTKFADFFGPAIDSPLQAEEKILSVSLRL